MPDVRSEFSAAAAGGVAAILIQLFSAAPVEAVKRRAFVTSVEGSGNLQSWPDSGGALGLAAGDNICRARAAAASLPNASTYRAWLSTASTDAYCHVQGQTGKKSTGCVGSATAAGPWYLFDGVGRVSGTLDQLIEDDLIYQPFRFDELGNVASGSFDTYWTGTGSSGATVSSNCSGWVVGTSGAQGSLGSPDRTTDGWTSGNISDCNEPHPLLCLEPGASEVTPVPWVPAALVFVSSETGTADLSSWPVAGGPEGLAAGDAICRNLAASAHLPSPTSFFAWLSTWDTDAVDRMTLAGVPFRRVDGFRVADSKADLIANGTYNSLHVDENGHYLPQAERSWTGTRDDGTAGVVTAQCAAWTTDDDAPSALTGFSNVVEASSWTDLSGVQCDAAFHLYCFSNREVLFWDGFDLSENLQRWSSTTP